MSLLTNITTDASLESEKDSLGGGRYTFDSAIYLAKIKMAFLEVSAHGAIGLNLTALINEQEYKETVWITNKDKQTFYVKDGQKSPLKGYLIAEAISLLTSGKAILEASTEKKIVKVYNYTAKAEVPTEVEVLTELLEKDIQLGILKELIFKRQKQQDGTYAESTDTQDANNISKVFHASNNKTVAECRAEAPEATFYNEWKNKWTGQIFDRTKGKTPSGQTGTTGLPSAPLNTAPINAPASKSLFN